jgi:hypothetical protein
MIPDNFKLLRDNCVLVCKQCGRLRPNGFQATFFASAASFFSAEEKEAAFGDGHPVDLRWTAHCDNCSIRDPLNEPTPSVVWATPEGCLRVFCDRHEAVKLAEVSEMQGGKPPSELEQRVAASHDEGEVLPLRSGGQNVSGVRSGRLLEGR